MNAHPAPPAHAPSGALGVWIWLALALVVVVVWWLTRASRR
jgi:cytochrome b